MGGGGGDAQVIHDGRVDVAVVDEVAHNLEDGAFLLVGEPRLELSQHLLRHIADRVRHLGQRRNDGLQELVGDVAHLAQACACADFERGRRCCGTSIARHAPMRNIMRRRRASPAAAARTLGERNQHIVVRQHLLEWSIPVQG